MGSFLVNRSMYSSFLYYFLWRFICILEYRKLTYILLNGKCQLLLHTSAMIKKTTYPNSKPKNIRILLFPKLINTLSIPIFSSHTISFHHNQPSLLYTQTPLIDFKQTRQTPISFS